MGMLVTGAHKNGDPRDVLEASHLSPDWSVWNLCDTGRGRFQDEESIRVLPNAFLRFVLASFVSGSGKVA